MTQNHASQGLTLAAPRQLHLSPPTSTARLLSATHTASGIAVFWSDGSLQQYERSAATPSPASSGSGKSVRSGVKAAVAAAEGTAPQFVRQLRDYAIPSGHEVGMGPF